MTNFNSYIDSIASSSLKSFFIENGRRKTYDKKEFFVVQNELSRNVAYIEDGIFQYSIIDESGNEHVVGFAFAGEFVCDYPSLIKEGASLVSIQALTECKVYELSGSLLLDYWDKDYETQKQGRIISESLYELAYMRFLDTYSTSEARYVKLMRRCPLLKELVPLKSIASYLGVSPETVSHIRRKILFGKNS